MLKIGVMGAGAIGCYVGGRLAGASHEVVFVGRPRLKEEIEANGLTLTDVSRKIPSVTVGADKLRVVTDPAALSDSEIVFVSVKSRETRSVGEILSEIVPKTTIVISLQNGLGNAAELRAHLTRQTVLGGIVGFNVVSKGAGVFRRATTGPIVIEACEDRRLSHLADALRGVGFQTELANDIRSQQWSKLILNLNNAVSALTDAPTQTLVFDPGYRRILGAIMTEALDVARSAGVRLAKVGPVPAWIFPWMLRLPNALLHGVSRLAVEIDAEARSSMWEDLSRGRLTEVDYLNGEIVRLAASSDQRAPLNERIVELVHRAEKDARGSPKLSADDLWAQLNAAGASS